MYKIAVFDYRILPNEQKIIQELASNPIYFPKKLYLKSELISITADAEIVLVTPWDKIDKEYLDACPNIKYIGLCGTSMHNLDINEIKKRGITYTNIVSKDKEPVAEFFFMHLVSLLRGSGKYQWIQNQSHELAGKSVGIIGLGHVGQAIAHLALAYKTNVKYYSKTRKYKWEELGVQYTNLNDLLKNSNIIFICTPTNVKVMHESEFNLLQKNTIIIQASGGSPFNQNAFIKWINKPDNYAIFDMSANEQNYELYSKLPGVIFSREVAGVTYESNQRRGYNILKNLRSYINSPKINFIKYF